MNLPTPLLEHVDEAVAPGRAKNRSDLIRRLLARDARRQQAEKDLIRLIDRGALRDPEALAIGLATATRSLED
jgi:Arc/MetJ-type ribon-helix-helix transcriptional regulator